MVQTLDFRISAASHTRYKIWHKLISVPWFPCVQDGNSNSTYFTGLLRELHDLLYGKHLEEKHSNCFSNYMIRTLIYNSVVFKLL